MSNATLFNGSMTGSIGGQMGSIDDGCDVSTTGQTIDSLVRSMSVDGLITRVKVGIPSSIKG